MCQGADISCAKHTSKLYFDMTGKYLDSELMFQNSNVKSMVLLGPGWGGMPN